jgi:sugar/nucleoside kinase (ribokinase family)
VLVTIGDLVEDVIVLVRGPVNIASDTDVEVTRRRGGSAANMASTAARLHHAVRFIGQIGDDAVADSIVAALHDDGVDVVVRRNGRTGTVVCLVDADGERTMLADRGACVDLAPADAMWLTGAHTLHVPFYSLAVGALARTSMDLISMAHDAGIRVSIDASSVGVLAALGDAAVAEILTTARPDVLLCNEDEARHLGQRADPASFGIGMTVVKRGRGPATATTADGTSLTVPARDIGRVNDTTGAGDAFAAGFLVALASGDDVEDALGAGHESAASLLLSSR